MWLKSSLGLFAATSCLLCGATVTGPTANLCAPCRNDLPRTGAACTVCGIGLPEAGVCPACLRRAPPFARTHAAFRYGPPVNHLVVLMKFGGKLAAARILGELLAEYLLQCPAQKPGVIIPVPLHGSRLRERGFNQALELARSVAQQWKIPIEREMVIRTRPTARQTELPNQAARNRNVRGAFALNGPRSGSLPEVGHVAVLDDVVTSGATVTEVARLLKRAGATQIDVWCCCRAGRL